MGLYISEMSGKLKGIDGINTNPFYNNFCTTMHLNKNKCIICTDCYSMEMLLTFRKKYCSPKWRDNGYILSEKLLTDVEISKLKFKNKYIRIDAHGELLNLCHFLNVVAIARFHKEKVFSLFTKRKDLLKYLSKKDKPKNLVIVYSNPKVDTPKTSKPLKIVDVVFNVITKDGIHAHLYNCHNRCAECLKCYKPNASNVIYEYKKNRKAGNHVKT